MPYSLYKKGPGYKACKPGGVECLSKKPLTKKKADKQRKAYYASRTTESLEFESKVAQLMSFEKKFEV